METFTLTEAARLTGLSREALRKRVNRGHIRSVLRDGVRRVPRSELERAGLHVGDPVQPAQVIAELVEKIAAQERELTQLRALPARVETEAAAREDLEARLRAEREWREQLVSAGWRQRRRLLRESRTQSAA